MSLLPQALKPSSLQALTAVVADDEQLARDESIAPLFESAQRWRARVK